MDNIVASKLYRKGSVGYVSKSGGMSNELNNIVSQTTDGVYEGVAIGGDRYPGTTFIDHMLRYQADPDCKILLLLGDRSPVVDERGGPHAEPRVRRVRLLLHGAGGGQQAVPVDVAGVLRSSHGAAPHCSITA